MKTTYQQAEDWLFNQLPMYQSVGKTAFKGGIYNIKKICEAFDRPQEKFKSIHVAGTNGKGSTCSLLASAFIENGWKTGLTVSPHLLDFRERLIVDGEKCSKDFVIDFVEQFKKKLPNLNPSFFELMIAMAFVYFAKQKVDIAIVETGMGGRLDSTNILQPELSIITNISLDHKDYLGDTLEKIAGEKARIIKEKTPVLLGQKTEKTSFVFEKLASEREAPLFYVEELHSPTLLSSSLKGNYQKENLSTAWHALHSLQLFELNEEKSKIGFNKVTENTGLRGRWEILSKKPGIVADCGHNIAAVEEIVRQIREENYRELHLVLGFVRDKDVEGMIRLFPPEANYYFAKPSPERGLSMKELKPLVRKISSKRFFDSAAQALDAAIKNSETNDFIFIGGSSFVVSDVLAYSLEKVCKI